MPDPRSIPYDTYKEETERAIEKCYPKEEGNALVSSKTVLYEINENLDDYPLYSQVKKEKKKKLIMSRVCIYILKWDLWAGSRGAHRNSAVYRRSL